MIPFQQQSSSDTRNRFSRALKPFRVRTTSSTPQQGIDDHDTDEDSAGTRSLTDSLDETEEDTKGKLGLNLLWDVPNPQVDFIFVHGLGGGSRKTWSALQDPDYFWPRSWLPKEPAFANVRIHTFGYAADWTQRHESLLSIRDFARSFINDIHCNAIISRSKTRIVLVAHSLGGIVAKKAFLIAKEDQDYHGLAERFHSIYFLATPHRGADLAGMLDAILRVSYPKTFVPELKPNSEAIMTINDSFRHVGRQLHLWSFYEKHKTSFGVGMQQLVVDESSATLGYDKEKPVPMNADHRSICKFKSVNDNNYKVLLNTFARTIEDIRLEVSKEFSRHSATQKERLALFGGKHDGALDDQSALAETRTPGTCSWLLNQQSFARWYTLQGRPIFWLTAGAGSGKSFLSSFVVDETLAGGSECSFFFFKKGVVDKYTVSDCLLSMAHQMAASYPTILDRLLETHSSESTFAGWDDKTIWRRMFVGCIFQISELSDHVWVIDAADECQRPSTLVDLFAQIPSWLRIFVTGRATHHDDRDFMKLEKLSMHYRINKEDTIQDFTMYIQSRMDRLPLHNEVSQSALASKILEKSSGSFLWISLVLQQLEQAYSEEEVEEIIDEVPEDMNALYAKILREVCKNPRVAKLAKSIFMWTLLPSRALKLSELQTAIKSDIDQTVPRLETSISAICGQLLTVNKNAEIEMVHQTAKSYLLDQDACVELVIDRPVCHTRIARIALDSLLQGFTSVRSQTNIPLRKTSITSTKIGTLLEYAAEFFSDHLQKSSSEDETNWNLLCKFMLSRSILAWIEHLAGLKKSFVILRTAKNLQAYFKRRIKYLPLFDDKRELVKTSLVDLAKLCSKFGGVLKISPAAIHTMVPSMCPAQSSIHRQFSAQPASLIIKGRLQECWDDCLLRIDYTTSQTSALAFGENCAAVGMSNGSIYIHVQDQNQEHFMLNHGERIKTLRLSHLDAHLVSAGTRTVQIWSLVDRCIVRSSETAHSVLSLTFLDDGDDLAIATSGGYITTWNLEQEALSQWHWAESIPANSSHLRPHQQPSKALFADDGDTLAVAYRGLPVYLFDTASRRFIGCCERFATAQLGKVSHNTIEALAFNYTSDSSLVIISHGDGELTAHDVDTTKLRCRIPDVFAHSLATSPDGRTLLAGGSGGALQIFEFSGSYGEKLTLLYRINSHEDGIKEVAFGGDSMRFADIRGAQLRIWEPDLLTTNEIEAESVSELSQAVTLPPENGTMGQSATGQHYTVFCHSVSMGKIFVGTEDGQLISFDITDPITPQDVCRHAQNTAISAVMISDNDSIMISADDSGLVLFNQIIPSTDKSAIVVRCIKELRLESTISRLLLSASGEAIIAETPTSLIVFKITGETIATIDIQSGKDRLVLFQPPTRGDIFAFMGQSSIQTFMWKTGSRVESSTAETQFATMNNASFEANQALPTKQVPVRNMLARVECSHDFVVYFSRQHTRSQIAKPQLSIYRVADLPPNMSLQAAIPTSLGIKDINEHIHKVKQIIAVHGDVLYFIDTLLWVCSMKLSSQDDIGTACRRHFFLLSEWQDASGMFLIEYLPLSREFVAVWHNSVRVFDGGLEFSEAWVKEP